MQNLLFAGGIGVISFSILSSLLYFLSQIRTPKMPKIKQSTLSVNQVSLVIGVLIFAIVLHLAKNIVPALLAVIIVVLVPSQIAYFLQRKRKKDILEQSATAVKIFTNDYAVSLNIKTAIQAVGNSTTGIVSEIFKDAYYQLSLGKNLESVLQDMGKKLGTSYGYLFTKLVNLASKKGVIILPLLHDLSARIRVAQDQENYKYTQIAVDNFFNLFLIIMPIFEYLILLKFVPEVTQFMFNTQLGSLIFTGWLVSIIIWFIVDRYVHDF